MRARSSTAHGARRAAGWLAALAIVGLACAGDPVAPSGGQTGNVHGSDRDAGRGAAPADAAQATRPASGLDARVVLPIEDPKPVRDAAVSGPNEPTASDAATTPAASDAAVSDTGVPGKGCDAKAGDCGPPTQVGCDASKVVCKRAPPSCPEGQVPAVVDTCWGECAGIEQCSCTKQDDCPDRDKYACHMSARHCGPYVN